MASAIGIVVNKSFTYRDVQGEQWSNKYWFQGTPPTTSAAWRTLFDTLVQAEKVCYSPSTQVVGGYAYDNDDPAAQAVWSVDLISLTQTVPGTLTVSSGEAMSGDQAGMFEFQTQRKNSRGKWIYLRKYMHGGGVSTADPDKISPATGAAYDVFVTDLLNGTWSTGHIIRSQKQVETFNWAARSPWVTTRTLKRRGKRP